MGVSALANGGLLIPPTFLKRSKEAQALAKRVIKPETSEKISFLVRLNAEIGTARKADVPGYYIGGKIGTAEKVVNGCYAKKRLTTFTAIIPADEPHYQLLIVLDEPQPFKETYGFITSGWNAVPIADNVIARKDALVAGVKELAMCWAEHHGSAELQAIAKGAESITVPPKWLARSGRC